MSFVHGIGENYLNSHNCDADGFRTVLGNDPRGSNWPHTVLWGLRFHLTWVCVCLHWADNTSRGLYTLLQLLSCLWNTTHSMSKPPSDHFGDFITVYAWKSDVKLQVQNSMYGQIPMLVPWCWKAPLFMDTGLGEKNLFSRKLKWGFFAVIKEPFF